MSELPSGTVTLLFADIAGRTRLARHHDEEAADLLDRYEDIITSVVAASSGRVLEASGDTMVAAFASAANAVRAAAEAQRRLTAEQWPAEADVRIAMGLHTGEPSVRRGRYVGAAVNRAALICQVAHPGQILLSMTTRALLGRPPEGTEIRDVGDHAFAGDDTKRLFQLVVEGVPADFPTPVRSAAGRALLPSGTVTFLFSDIEGSTELLRRLGDRWGPARADHRRVIREAASSKGGREVDTQGDSFFFVFARARDAVTAAEDAQRALAVHHWPEGTTLRVRMGIHTGEPGVDEEGYLGLDVVRGARICAVAAGGQVLVSETTRALLGGQDGGPELRYVGERELKGLPAPERLYELAMPGVRPSAAPVPAGAASESPLLEGGVERLTQRVREATFDLGAQIQQQVERELREAGVPSDLTKLAALSAIQRKPTRGMLLLGRFVITLVVGVIVGLIVLVLLLVL